VKTDRFPEGGLVRLKSILAPTRPIPVAKSTWWAGVKSGRYPRPVRPANGCVAFKRHQRPDPERHLRGVECVMGGHQPCCGRTVVDRQQKRRKNRATDQTLFEASCTVSSAPVFLNASRTSSERMEKQS
jgi:hypothetical protein